MSTNKPKHTEAPWIYDRSTAMLYNPTKRANGGYRIADLSGTDRDANAELIAAAPEMLEALKRAQAALIEVGVSSGYEDVFDLLKEAISKAEGREG